MTSGPFAGQFYDGRTAQARAVDLMIEDDQLVLIDASGAQVLRAPVSSVGLSEPFSSAPRMVNFFGGETLQVDNALEVTQALGAAGHAPPLVARLQASWPLSAVASLLVVALLIYAYMAGLPAAARWAAPLIPQQVQQRMGEALLELIDQRSLRPTKLPEARRSAIAGRFSTMAQAVAPDSPYRLEFRTAKDREDKINAFALPGGIIVLLDGLVDAAENDDQVIGVLGHELGHVAYHHSMQRLLQAVGLGALTGLAWGDFSGVAANVPWVLGIFRYSRADERAADEFAVRLLRSGGLSAQPLIEFFEIIQAKYGKYTADVPDFLSSHPATADRIEWLRSQN